MSDVSEIIAEYSQALEACRATLRAQQQFAMDRARTEKSTPLRLFRKRTNYGALSSEELVNHKESLLEGIFHDHISNKISERVSATTSDVKTKGFLGHMGIIGVTAYIPKPITTLLGTAQHDDSETARVYHHRIIDDALQTDLSMQANECLENIAYPYATVEQSGIRLVSKLAAKMHTMPSAVSAKEAWIREPVGADINDILKVYDGSISSPSPLAAEDAHSGDTLALLEEPARTMSLEWIEQWTDDKRTDLYDDIVKSIKKETPGLDPSEVEAKATELTEELIGKQWSEEEEQHQKALDRLSAYFTKRPPSDDYASSVDLFPIVFEHNLKDDATGKERATDPNGVKTVLTTGGEGNRSLESFLPPAFSELLSQA